MLSFKILTPETRDEILSEIFEKTPEADRVYATDILTLYSEDDSAEEYAATSSDGCLLVRCYDGEYSFSYPIRICESADPVKAALEIRAYAVKEEIPLVYYDVPKKDVGDLVVNFRHVNIDSSNYPNLYFTVRVMSELSLVDEMPEYTNFFGYSLTRFTPEDDEDYARLCTDKETNEFWGYDYSEDEPNPDKSYFRQVAESEFYQSRALCLALRHKGKFIGEGTLYYFDFLGGCECAVRILPEYRKMGYATQAMRILKTIARNMGIIHLKAQVDVRNSASLRLADKFLYEEGRDGKVATFKRKIVNID